MYIFFLRVLRRLVTLITQLAKEMSNKGVLQSQAENTNKAAKKFMEENEKLKWVFKFPFNSLCFEEVTYYFLRIETNTSEVLSRK